MPHRTDSIQSVGRALDVLDALRLAPPEGVRVTDLAQALGVDAATVTRLLQTLASRGYASQLATRRYTLGPSAARLPERWLDRVLTTAGPVLGELAQATGETIYLLEQLGGRAATVATMRPAARPALECEVGPSFPLWATAAGHALLAPLPPCERVRLLPPEPYPAFTPTTPRRWGDLMTFIRRGEDVGVFRESACFARGVECLAAPIETSGGILAIAVSFRAPSVHRGWRRRAPQARATNPRRLGERGHEAATGGRAPSPIALDPKYLGERMREAAATLTRAVVTQGA